MSFPGELLRPQSIESQLISKPGFIQYFVAFTRLLHGFTAVLPALLLIWWLNGGVGDQGKYYTSLLLFFALITVLLFQALGVYSEELFSNRLRFRLMARAWLLPH